MSTIAPHTYGKTPAAITLAEIINEDAPRANRAISCMLSEMSETLNGLNLKEMTKVQAAHVEAAMRDYFFKMCKERTRDHPLNVQTFAQNVVNQRLRCWGENE